MEVIEIDDIIVPAWAIITQRMVQQQVKTPQGVQIIHQPVDVPIVFKNLDEMQKYVKEQYNNKDAAQIVLQKIEYPLSQENKIEFYYK